MELCFEQGAMFLAGSGVLSRKLSFAQGAVF